MRWHLVSVDNLEASDEFEGSGAREKIVSSGGFFGIWSKTSEVPSLLAPMVGYCSDVCPPILIDKVVNGANIFCLCIEVSDNDRRALGQHFKLEKASSDEGICLRSCMRVDVPSSISI